MPTAPEFDTDFNINLKYEWQFLGNGSKGYGSEENLKHKPLILTLLGDLKAKTFKKALNQDCRKIINNFLNKYFFYFGKSFLIGT